MKIKMAFERDAANHESAGNIERTAAAAIEGDIRFGCVNPRDTCAIGGKDNTVAAGKAVNFECGRVLINIVDGAVAGIKRPAGIDLHVRVAGDIERQIITVLHADAVGQKEDAVGGVDENTRLVVGDARQGIEDFVSRARCHAGHVR